VVYLRRKVEFCASHRLYNAALSDEENLALYGRCANPSGHGHNYTLEVTIRGSMDPRSGMVMDLKELKQIIVEEIIEKVDHKNLNTDVDFLQGVIPTSENLVVCFWKILEKRLQGRCELYEVRLWETENNVVFYRGEPAEVVRHGAFSSPPTPHC